MAARRHWISATTRWRLVALAAVGATIVAAAVAPTERWSQPLFFLVALFALIIPLHELGHAIAATLVGYRVMAVVVGTGPELARFRWLGVGVQINLLPLGGMTMPLPARPHGSIRLRQWIVTAGGPLANVLLFVALRCLFGPALTDDEQHPFFATVAMLNWFTLAVNLIPIRTAEGPSSDGYSLFTIPFWTARRIEATHLSFRGALLHRERQHAAALAAWREGLAKTDDPKLAAILKNNVAFAMLFADEGFNLAEADRLSAEALTVFPQMASVIGTRGAVLQRLGRAAEALPMLVTSTMGTFDSRNQAYGKAILASALAALGRHDEAVAKLEEARRTDPECDLLGRAEADIAAGLVPAAAAPVPPLPDAVAHGPALRAWRRDARIVAFASMFLLFDRVGLDLAPPAILIAVSMWPELGSVFALAGYGLSAALLYGLGLARVPFFMEVAPWATAASTLALGIGAGWLIARHRRMGPPPRTRTPTVLGWILTALAFLVLLVHLFRLAMDGWPLGIHGLAERVLRLAPGLVGLAALLATRRRRGVRLLAVVPVTVALLAVVPGSRWYRDRFSLAGIPAEGPAIAWSDPTPATVVRTAQVKEPGDASLSPGARTFFVAEHNVFRSRFVIHVGDFDGRADDINATAAAFVDDKRLLVVTRGSVDAYNGELAEVRPFQKGSPIWTKVLPGIDVRNAEIHIDRATGTVFVISVADAEGSAMTRMQVHPGAPMTLRTTTDPGTPVEVSPLKHLRYDEPLAVTLPMNGWGGMLVERARWGTSSDIFWRTQGDERHIASSLPLNCIAPRPGTPTIWCLMREEPILFGVDTRTPRLTRLPGEVPWHRDVKMLGPSVIATARAGEIQVIDLNTGRGTRLKLPDVDSQAPPALIEGGLATLARRARTHAGPLVVYQNPFE